MPRTREISNSDDIIDSRDVIARIRELEADAEPTDCPECDGTGRPNLVAPIDENTRLGDESELEECEECDGSGCIAPEMDDDDRAELAALRALVEEAQGCSDWKYGAALINDSYFEDYARETASDIYGREIDEARWPFDCIDWGKAADELKQDYTSVDFDGVTYWVR